MRCMLHLGSEVEQVFPDHGLPSFFLPKAGKQIICKIIKAFTHMTEHEKRDQFKVMEKRMNK